MGVMYLLIMVSSPLDLLQKVTEISFEGDVVHPRLELLVKVLIIDGVMFEHHTVSCKQIRQPVRCYCPVNIYLVLILLKEKHTSHLR